MKRFLLSLTLSCIAAFAFVQGSHAQEAKASIADIALSVAPGSAFDEDGMFPVKFTYTATVDESLTMPYGMVYYTIYDQTGATVSTNYCDFDVAKTERTLYIPKLAEGNTYTCVLDDVQICDFSLETFEEVVICSDKSKAEITFAVPAPHALISGMALKVKPGSKIAEDGTFAVTFTYAIEKDETLVMPYANAYYTVYDETGEEVVKGFSDLDVDKTERNFYISSLTDGKNYTIVLDKIDICDFDLETFAEVSVLTVEPKITLSFSVPTPAAMISDLALSVEDGAVIDPKDGSFPVKCSYLIEKDASLAMPWANAYYTVYDATGAVVVNGFSDLDVDKTERNFYISSLVEGKTYTIVLDKVEVCDFDLETFMEVLVLTVEPRISLQFTVASPTAISEAQTAAKAAKADGKFFQNGTIVILKNGVKYNAQGMRM